MREAVIVGAARTAIAKENGGLRDVPPETLTACCGGGQGVATIIERC